MSGKDLSGRGKPLATIDDFAALDIRVGSLRDIVFIKGIMPGNKGI
ncbi:hypothetical protein ACE6ED_11310 [Paenibacillus sp. CN-4]